MEKTTIISESAVRGYQSIDYTLILSLLIKDSFYKIKVSIKRDSYEQQSYAIGYIWNNNELMWHKIYEIPYQQMRTLDSTRDKSLLNSLFIEDKERILDIIEKILITNN